MLLKIRLFVLLTFLGSSFAFAQSKLSDNLHGELNVHSGYNLPEYPFIYSLTKDYIRSVDLSIYKSTSGKNKWEQIYNYPDYGLSLFYSTLGNDEVFGRELALTYFFRVYVLSRKRFRLYNRTGIGLNYVSKKFSLERNYLNVAVGSNYNVHFNFRLGAMYDLTDKMALNTGISFDHFSNGNTAEPNLGLNYLTAYGGLSYRLGSKAERKIRELEEHEKEESIIVFTSIGGKHSRALSSKFFITSSLSVEYDKAISRKVSLGVGGDFFYDSSVKNSLEKLGQSHQTSDNFQSGVHLSQTLRYNRFSLSLQEGVYLILKEKVDKYVIYNRGIIQYQVTPKLAVRLAMKSHLHILDFPEIGLGYTL